MKATMLTVSLSSFLLLSMTKTWHMLRVFGIRKGALVELLHDFFWSLQKIWGHANTDISDIFRILYNIFGQQILPVDGRKGRPLSPKKQKKSSTMMPEIMGITHKTNQRSTFSLALAWDTAWKFITLVIPIPQNMAKASTKYSSLLKLKKKT